MDNAKQHWKILQKLENDLANRVRSFLVIGKDKRGVIVATESGQGYWLGEMRFGLGESKTANEPTSLDVPDLISMAQSYEHILLLNKQGEIYSMGRNNLGQLGLGTVNLETCFLPQLISILHKFISVRCGGWHNLALTEDGKVWSWGWNVLGQVGVPSSTCSLSTPRQISELDPYRVVAVECGGCHSLALTGHGEVYAWGGNQYGQLGNRSETSTHIPTQILTPSPVQSMAAGSHHTLLLTRTKEVYVCGFNGDGKLGFSNDIYSSPCLSKIDGLPPISQIASHPLTFISIVMSSKQRCFVWSQSDKTFFFAPRKLSPFYSTVESPLSFYSSYFYTPHSVSIPESKFPPNRLSSKMSRMFDNPETSPDVQFVVEQRTIHAHRIILNNSSDYFATLLSERWLGSIDPEDPIIKVTISDHSYQVFYAFLRFLYTDCLELYSDLLPELFELASKYLVPGLQQLCLLRMRTTLTPFNCCHYYQLTLRHPTPELEDFQQELIQFIFTNFSEVISTDEGRLILQKVGSFHSQPLPITISENHP